MSPIRGLSQNQNFLDLLDDYRKSGRSLGTELREQRLSLSKTSSTITWTVWNSYDSIQFGKGSTLYTAGRFYFIGGESKIKSSSKGVFKQESMKRK